MDHQTPSFPFQNLPFDIQILALETAAGDTDTALRLAGVSRSVRRWTEPILYRRVRLENAREARDFHWSIQNSSKCQGFFENQVKHLLSTHNSCLTLRQLRTVLNACKNVISLAIWINNDSWLAHLSNGLENVQVVPKRLSAYVPFFPTGLLSSKTSVLEKSSCCYYSLTRLDILVDIVNADQWKGFDFRHLENLTHLSLDLTSCMMEKTHGVLPHVISLCPPRLRVLLVLVSRLRLLLSKGHIEMPWVSGERDPRVVFVSDEEEAGGRDVLDESVVYCGIVQLTTETWLSSIPGSGKDMWDLAEDIISARR